MRLNTGRIKLHSAMKTLAYRWDDTKPGWNDPVCREFEEQYYLPLEQQVAATLRAIDRMAQVLEQVHRDLEEPPV